MRHRRIHDLRRTFISLARDGGADKLTPALRAANWWECRSTRRHEGLVQWRHAGTSPRGIAHRATVAAGDVRLVRDRGGLVGSHDVGLARASPSSAREPTADDARSQRATHLGGEQPQRRRRQQPDHDQQRGPPDNREPRLVLQRRYEEAKADSITDTVIFTNNGNRATHLLDMRVLDADDNQVMSYKPPCDLVDPRLPANIEPGHAVTFKLKITAEQTQRARWFEWVREGQVNERRPWTNRDLYIYVSAAVASPGSS